MQFTNGTPIDEQLFHWNRFIPMVPMAPIDKATLTNGYQFTNGTIGEDVLTIGICLCTWTCVPKGMVFSDVLVINNLSILAILVLNIGYVFFAL